MADPTVPSNSFLARGKGWLLFFGAVSLVVGILAIVFPLAATVAIEQVIGIFCVVSGVFSIGSVTFGDEKSHRILTIVLALIRLVTGLALLVWIPAGVLALTVVLGAFFVAEGIIFLISGFALAGNARVLMLLNGVVALILGGMVFAQFPSSAAWLIGLLYGINSIFYGISLLVFASSLRPAN